jgi:hypothetical protein
MYLLCYNFIITLENAATYKKFPVKQHAVLQQQQPKASGIHPVSWLHQGHIGWLTFTTKVGVRTL